MSDYKIDTLEVESQIIAPAATTSVAGLQSPTDKTKLDGVAVGATANSPDAALRDRATHTGTQLSTTISDFTTAASTAAPVQSVAGKTGTVSLVKGDVGLGNVDNTSDLSKPISTLTQTALNNKYDASNPNGYQTASQVSATVAALVDTAPATLDTLNELAAALGDDPNFASTMTTALAGKEPTITAGTTGQYYRGDKSFQTLDKTAVGLANIDNTSDANKPISTATQTALNLKYDATNPSGYQTATQVTSTVSAASTIDRDRTNHTGTQLSSTISDITETVQDVVGAFVVAGTGITSTYNDVANTLTVASTITQYTDEQAQDAVGTILTDSSSVDFTYNDVANTITAAVLPAGVNHNTLQNYVANEHVNHSTVSITAGTGLSGGGDITTTRTLNIANTTVTAGSYGNSTNVPTFTVNAQGQITASSNTAITFPVTSIFGRAGAVIAQTGDYTAAQVGAAPSSHVGSSGASEHAVATQTVAGFMSTGDKTKLDGLPFVIPVSSVFSRTGTIVAQANDYTFAQIDKTTSSLADLTTRSAGDLSSGTLLDARLSTNVPLKNAANTFTASQTIDVAGASSTLNIDANGSTTNPAKIVFVNTSGTGDCQIVGDGGDFGLQSGGSRALQHYAFHEIVLQGGRTTGTPASFIAGSNATYNTRILNTNDSIGLNVQAIAGQTADLLQITDSANVELVTVTASGQVGVGQGAPASSAKFEVSSTTQGFLPPRMTTAQRLAIVSPAEGLFVFDTDFNTLCEYSGTSWKYEVRVNTTAIQTSTSTTYANITEFTTLGLEAGLYVLELKGIMQSTATTTGVGLRLAAGTATISSVVLNWTFSQAGAGTNKNYEYSQLTTADNLTSPGVVTANTNLPVFGNGIFRLSIAGTVAIQLRTEVNASGVSIRPNSTLMLKKIG